MLDSTARRLRGQYVFNGENRVAGTDLPTIAWLVWNSPAHRELLLRSDANTVAINVKKRGDLLYVVLAVGRKVR
jgi:hypothetical protein